MDPKTALNEVVHVLHDIEDDRAHAAEHSGELAEAVAHLREAHVEVPASLEGLTRKLEVASNRAIASDAGIEDQFDNMPV